jgi:hypothetical protein
VAVLQPDLFGHLYCVLRDEVDAISASLQIINTNNVEDDGGILEEVGQRLHAYLSARPRQRGWHLSPSFFSAHNYLGLEAVVMAVG